MFDIKKEIIFIALLLVSTNNLFAQNDSLYLKYVQSFNEINSLAQVNKATAFKDAVYCVENTYWNGYIDKIKFDEIIHEAVTICKTWEKSNPVTDYKETDLVNFSINRAIFKLLKDTVRIATDNGIISLLPYEYDFDDFEGRKDWSKMFVTKLMNTHKGNCHSLPYFYKIIADELGAKCWLALAPNHIYIRNYLKQSGWYNTELTSGDFPIDAWLLTPNKSLSSGIGWLFLSGEGSNAKGEMNWRNGNNGDWYNAVQKYGPGGKSYSDDVKNMVDNSQAPKADNYVQPAK